MQKLDSKVMLLLIRFQHLYNQEIVEGRSLIVRAMSLVLYQRNIWEQKMLVMQLNPSI